VNSEFFKGNFMFPLGHILILVFVWLYCTFGRCLYGYPYNNRCTESSTFPSAQSIFYKCMYNVHFSLLKRISWNPLKFALWPSCNKTVKTLIWHSFQIWYGHRKINRSIRMNSFSADTAQFWCENSAMKLINLLYFFSANEKRQRFAK
jgi:hypothetical protein